MKTGIWEKLAKIDEKQRYYLFVGCLLFLFLLDYFVLMRPQLAALTKLGPEINVLSQDIQKTKEEIAKTSFYEGEAARLKERIAQIDSGVRSKDEVPLILERISRLANHNGVKIDQIMPFSQDQEILLEDNQRTYFALPILLQARSGYHDLGRFLNQMEKDDVALKVTMFTIASGGDPKYHQVELNLEATIFEGRKER